MNLQIESIDIRELKKGAKTCVSDHVLTVNLKELEQVLLKGSGCLRSVDIHLVYPGDSVRIVNLMDVVQPRCKVDVQDADFPGFIGKVQRAGVGRTRSLRGIAVVVANPYTKRHYSALLDMSGKAAELSKYGQMRNVVVVPHMAEDAEDRDFEDAVKIAGLKTAVYLAQAADGHPADEIEHFDLHLPSLPRDNGLPRVACYYQLYTPQHDYKGISDKCFYGTDVRNLLPTIIHPNEVLDGGVTGHQTIRSLDTYTVQNHGVIKELYSRHGRDLTFCGVVIGVANMDPVQRQRKAMMASGLIANVLGADGVMTVKAHGGMPHVDTGLVAEECEKLGVKTVYSIQCLVGHGSLAEAAIYGSNLLDAIVVTGAPVEKMKLAFKPERVLGGSPKTKIYHPDPVTQFAGDSTIEVEEFLIAGVHDQTCGARIIVSEY
jgi:hypothetical protein